MAVEAFAPISSTVGLLSTPTKRERKDLAEQLADYAYAQDIIRDRKKELPPAVDAYTKGIALGMGSGALLGAPKAYIAYQHPGTLDPRHIIAGNMALGGIGGAAVTALRRHLAGKHLRDARGIISEVSPTVKELTKTLKKDAKEYADVRNRPWLGAEIGAIGGGLAGAIAGGFMPNSVQSSIIYGTGAGVAGAVLGYLLGREQRKHKRKVLLNKVVNHLG